MTEAYYGVVRRGHIETILRILRCIKLEPPIENFRNSELLVFMGSGPYHFYIVNSADCEIHKNSRGKSLYFPPDKIVRNIHVSGVDSSIRVNGLKDETEQSKRCSNLIRSMNDYFKLKDIYIAPRDIEKLLDREILLREAIIRRRMRKIGRENILMRQINRRKDPSIDQKYYEAFMARIG